MPSSTAQNLAVIDAAIKQHRERCSAQLLEIRMSPFEVERLGWDDYQGIPIKADDSIGTGRFHLVCEADRDPANQAIEQVEAVVPVAPIEVGDTTRIPLAVPGVAV
jgi:hypothetical protein